MTTDEKIVVTLVPCDVKPIEHNIIEGPNGWSTTPWKKGEKEAYARAALMKPATDDRYQK
jgi:hypothetical protein